MTSEASLWYIHLIASSNPKEFASSPLRTRSCFLMKMFKKNALLQSYIIYLVWHCRSLVLRIWGRPPLGFVLRTLRRRRKDRRTGDAGGPGSWWVEQEVLRDLGTTIVGLFCFDYVRLSQTMSVTFGRNKFFREGIQGFCSSVLVPRSTLQWRNGQPAESL